METIIIDEKTLMEAKTYLPYSEKVAFVENVANRCFAKINITADTKNRKLIVPPMYMENYGKKEQYLLSALVNRYLGLNAPVFEDDAEMLLPDEYDKYAGSHILNQLERFKKVKSDVQNIVFDMMDDYKLLCRMLTKEMDGMYACQNDLLTRANLLLQTSATPDEIFQNLDEMKRLTDELEQYKQKRVSAK